MLTKLMVVLLVVGFGLPLLPWVKRLGPTARRLLLWATMGSSLVLLVVFPRVGLWITLAVVTFWLLVFSADGLLRWWLRFLLRR